MNKKVIYILVFLISFIIIFTGIYWFLLKSKPGKLEVVRVTVGAQTFNAELANTIRSRAQGLSGHAPLSEIEGMYFTFPLKARYPFWMKDMAYPLDIVWIADGKIVGVSENIPAPEDKNILTLPTYSPPQVVSAVLELNAGAVKKFGLKVGDEVKI